MLRKILEKALLASLAISAIAAEEMRVAVRPSLVLRDRPEIKGSVAGKIPFRATVSVLDKSGPEATVMGITGKWMQVAYADKKGWVFGAFLLPPAETKYFDIVAGTATMRDPAKCLTMRSADFPKFFNGGCLDKPCGEGCAGRTLNEDRTFSYQDGCDGAGGGGKWYAKGSKVFIEYSVSSLPPEELCAYRDGSPECLREEEKKFQRECGDKSGCTRKYKRILEMPKDNEFTLDGVATCVYP